MRWSPESKRTRRRIVFTRHNLPVWRWVAVTVSSVVLFAVAVPNAATLYGLPVAVAFLAGFLLVLCGPLALRAPRLAIGSWVFGQSIFVWFGQVRHDVPWPMAVVGLLTLCELLIILGLRKPWYYGVAAWALAVLSALQVLIFPDKGTTAAGVIANLVTTTAISSLTLIAALLVAQTVGFRSQLRTEQEVSANEQARRVLVEERNRIARDLHDVVAHSMSIIQVQATSAPYRIEGLDDRARQEFSEIAESARAALQEMRALLGVLRSEDAATELRPQPTLAQLGELAAALDRAGIEVGLSIGDDVPRTGVVSSALYRIVQEALSNVVRHAPGSGASVEIAARGRTLELVVTNTAPPDPRSPSLVSDGRGHGLLGMRERAAAVGGAVEFGPTPDGGFRVFASLPRDAE